MQTRKHVGRNQRVETAAERERNIRRLTERMGSICAKFYDYATPQKQEMLFALLDEFDAALIRYRNFEEPWDSVLITLRGHTQGVEYPIQAISTFDTPMDKARDIFGFIHGEEK